MGEVDLELRKYPVQQRAQLRFASILDAGRMKLAAVGVDGFTLELVAEAAGVPIGSIYQYFPNKHALIAELSAQDTNSICEELRQAATRLPTEDWQPNVDQLINDLADMWRRDTTRRHVWLAMQSTSATRSRAAEQTGHVVEHVIALVSPLTPNASPKEIRVVAEVVVQMCLSLLHFSVHDDRPHQATVHELKRALRSYLRAVALGATN